jgi:hypothetical protein
MLAGQKQHPPVAALIALATLLEGPMSTLSTTTLSACKAAAMTSGEVLLPVSSPSDSTKIRLTHLGNSAAIFSSCSWALANAS